jgi:ribulose-phosphate 3-epimerase
MKPAGNVQIAPSLLSADFARLADAVAAAERAGADMIHFDVMDGHFVPNITIGPPVLKSVARATRLPIDVHLMIENPDRYIEAFVEAGAASISVHVEAAVHLHRVVHFIKSLGVKAGVVLNPATPVSALEQIAGDVDFVLVMTVNPGFGGQTFIPRSESKVRAVRDLLRREGSTAPIEVDGGIDVRTAPRIVAAGADILVAGNAVFGSPDPERAIRELRAAAGSARLRREAATARSRRSPRKQTGGRRRTVAS